MHVYDGHAPPVVAEEGAVGKHPALSVADEAASSSIAHFNSASAPSRTSDVST
jgi:hypothetical protein